MNIVKCIKNNRFFRGFYYLYHQYFGFSPKSFGYFGDNITLIPPLTISNPKNVFLYGSNKLAGAIILTTNAKFIMKHHSRGAYNLKVITGNHAMKLGRFYCTIREDEKPKGLDKDVIVESDVWIGTNVTLLPGVTVGRGSTLASGTVVTKDVLPYSVVGGVPAHFIKFKWTIDEILQHEAALYPVEERFTREQLTLLFKKC